MQEQEIQHTPHTQNEGPPFRLGDQESYEAPTNIDTEPRTKTQKVDDKDLKKLRRAESQSLTDLFIRAE
jgi:hypothetical protein